MGVGPCASPLAMRRVVVASRERRLHIVSFRIGASSRRRVTRARVCRVARLTKRARRRARRRLARARSSPTRVDGIRETSRRGAASMTRVGWAHDVARTTTTATTTTTTTGRRVSLSFESDVRSSVARVRACASSRARVGTKRVDDSNGAWGDDARDGGAHAGVRARGDERR